MSDEEFAKFIEKIREYVRGELLSMFTNGYTSDSSFRAGMVLTPEAEDDRVDFEKYYSDRGCTCFISPPCSYCVHPGNPRNQEEGDDCWMYALKY